MGLNFDKVSFESDIVHNFHYMRICSFRYETILFSEKLENGLKKLMRKQKRSNLCTHDTTSIILKVYGYFYHEKFKFYIFCKKLAIYYSKFDLHD